MKTTTRKEAMRVLIVSVALLCSALLSGAALAFSTNESVIALANVQPPNIDSALKLKDCKVFGRVVIQIVRPKELTTGPFELVARPIDGNVSVVFLPCSEETALRLHKGKEMSIVGTVSKVNASHDGRPSSQNGVPVSPNIGLVIGTGWTGK